MKTVVDIIDTLTDEITIMRGKIAAMESFRDRIAHANGLVPMTTAFPRLFSQAQAMQHDQAAAQVLVPPAAAPDARVPLPRECLESPAPKAKRKPRSKLIIERGTATVQEPLDPPAPRARVEDPGKIAAVRELPEPFTSASLAVALGVTVKCAGLQLWRWKQKGWVESPARGQWRRTANYPRPT